MSIIVRDKDGNRKKIAGVGLPGLPGKSAYQYAVEGGYPDTEQQFTEKLAKMQFPGVNLLDNWYWANRDAIINQRGQTEYTGAGYTIDRWKLRSTGHIQLTNDGIKLSKGEYLQQPLEQEILSAMVGRAVTGSCLLSDNSLFSGTIIVDSFDVTDWLTIVHDVKNGHNIYIQFANGCFHITDFNADTNIVAAKLELGSVQTLAHQDASGNWVLNDPPPDKATELAKCQRYQIVSTEISSPYCGIAISDHIIWGPNVFPTTMRITPVPTNIRIRSLTTGSVFEEQVTALWGTPLGFSAIEISAGPPLTPGSWYQIIAIFDANL